MSANVTIAPLPEAEEDTQLGNSPFVYGYYGLEGCSVRGIVRVSLPPSQPQIHVISLSVSLLGTSRLSYSSEGGDSHSVKKILVKETVDLLDDITLSDDIDFPFTIDLPDPMHRQPTMAPIVQSAVRTANLLPPSMLCKGISVHSYPFEAAVQYELVAELVLSNTPSFPLSFIMAPSTPITARVNVSPFIVHDPRQLPSIMLSDSKRWRSAPGDSPLEYELELGATTIGPGDTFSFLYRLAVARDAAAKGVKVKKVSLLLREHRTLGTTMHSLVPAAYKCVRSSNEIKRWEFEDTEPPGFEDLMMDDTADGDAFDKDDFAFEIEGDGDLRSYAEEPVHRNSSNNEASSVSDGIFSKNESMDLLANEKPQTSTNIESGAAPLYEVHPSRPSHSSSQAVPQSYHSPQLASTFGVSSPRLNGRKIKYQTRQTHKKKLTALSTASPSRSNQKNLPKNAGNNVEMSELRPRRKLADGMTFYNASHLQSTNASTYDHHLQPSNRGGRFSDGWSGGPGGDGLYVEHEARITMPKLSQITPSSFKPGDPNLAFPNPHNHIYASVPYIDIKHTLQVRIELHGVEKPIVHECWAVVTSVGKRECEAVLENRCELMPTLDYEKVFGTGVWVPAYEEVDPFLGEAGGSGFSSSVDPEEQFEEEDDLARFFGPWKTLVQRPPRADDSRPTSWDPSKGGPSSIGFMEPDALAPGYRSRSMSLAPVIPSHTPFNESNYFQKRPSISSILSFTSFNLPASGPTSPNHSEFGSDDNYQQADDEHQDEDSNAEAENANLSDFDTLPTPTTSNPLQLPPAATKRKKQTAKKRSLPPSVSTIPTTAARSSNQDRPNPPPPPPRLMSAHSLIAFDAVRVAALQDPLNEQLLREIQAYKRNSHYPQTRLDQSSNGSFGEDDEEKDDDDGADSDITGIVVGEGMHDNFDQQNRDAGYMRHPLLGDEEIEARRRAKAVRKMIKKQNGGTGHSNGESSRASEVGNDLPPGYTSA
ncbi:hypothetical protein HDU81_001273 [Chytriomyces hyalinus]|nr:hypothetical protein HDU81_001273 [Chytriomyces hyalinus]